MLDVTLTGVPGFEGRAGGERVGVGLGDLGLGDLGGVDGDGQWGVDIRGRQEGLALRVEVDWLESGRGLAVGVLQHRVTFVVVSSSCVWIKNREIIIVKHIKVYFLSALVHLQSASNLTPVDYHPDFFHYFSRDISFCGFSFLPAEFFEFFHTLMESSPLSAHLGNLCVGSKALVHLILGSLKGLLYWLYVLK